MASPDFHLLTDLHTHLAGNLRASTLVKLALEKAVEPISYPVAVLKKIKIDTGKYKDVTTEKGIALTELSPADLRRLEAALSIPMDAYATQHTFDPIYQLRMPITNNKGLFKDILREIADDYKEDGIKYAELSRASIIGDPDLLRIAQQALPQIEKETGVRLRFLAGLWRHADKNYNWDEIDRIKAIAKSPYVVGVDFMGQETNPTRDFADQIKAIAKWAIENDPSFIIRVHAGETAVYASPDFINAKTTPDKYHNIQEALQAVLEARKEVANERKCPVDEVPIPPVRIGHGIFGLNDATIALMKKTGAVVELNLSPNLMLHTVEDIQEIPIRKYIDAGIPFVLGQDGKGIYDTSAGHEVFLAREAHATDADFKELHDFETRYIEAEQSRFMEKDNRFRNAVKAITDSGVPSLQAYKQFFHPAYSSADGAQRVKAKPPKKNPLLLEDAAFVILHGFDPDAIDPATGQKGSHLTVAIKRAPDKNDKDKGLYGALGGFKQGDESLEQAACREGMEELGNLIDLFENKLIKLADYVDKRSVKIHPFSYELTLEQLRALQRYAEKTDPQSDKYDPQYTAELLRETNNETAQIKVIPFHEAVKLPFYEPHAAQDYIAAAKQCGAALAFQGETATNDLGNKISVTLNTKLLRKLSGQSKGDQQTHK